METKRCPVCASECPMEATYCHSCQKEFSKTDETINGIPVADLRAKVERQRTRYISIFRNNQDKPVFFHFNLAAMLFGSYWYFYRSMWAYGLLWWAINTVSTMLSILFVPASLAFLWWVPGLLLRVASGFLGDWLYRQYIIKPNSKGHTYMGLGFAMFGIRFVTFCLCNALLFEYASILLLI